MAGEGEKDLLVEVSTWGIDVVYGVWDKVVVHKA